MFGFDVVSPLRFCYVVVVVVIIVDVLLLFCFVFVLFRILLLDSS